MQSLEKERQKMQRGKPPEGYLTATQAKRMLGGISDGLLKTYVDRHFLERLVPTGRRQGFYNQTDVRKLAKELDSFPSAQSNHPGDRFQQAKEQDIPGAVELLIDVFGGGNSSQKRIEWMKKNPEIAFVLKSKDAINGVIFVIPLTKERNEEIFALPHSASTRVITTQDIQPYLPNYPVSLYIASFAVRPGLSPQVKAARGSLLLRGLYTHFIDLGKRGIILEQITGRSDTKDGINLLKKMGFTEIEPVGTNRNFLIDVARSGIPSILRYKEALSSAMV